MGAPSVANILKSGATFYYADEGESLPATTLAAGASWGGNWQRVGFTKAPLQLAYNPEYFQIDVDEYLSSVDEVRISEDAAIETVLAEVTAEYLTLLAGGGDVTTTPAGASQPAVEEVDIGGEARLKKYIVGFEGVRYDDDDNALPIRFFLRRATLKMGAGSLEFSKRSSDYTGLELRAEALADLTSGSEGRLIKLQRITAPATS